MSRIYGDSRQLGMVVQDIDEGIRAASELMGIGPFFIMREVRPEWFKYRGADSTPPLLSLAFAFSGPLQLELIQQHDDAPSAYKEFLDRGRQGPQHLSSWSKTNEEYDLARASALETDAVIIHEGKLGPGRFAYFDTVESSLGLCFEIAEGLIPEYAPVMADMQASSVDWDGTVPIRSFV